MRFIVLFLICCIADILPLKAQQNLLDMGLSSPPSLSEPPICLDTIELKNKEFYTFFMDFVESVNKDSVQTFLNRYSETKKSYAFFYSSDKISNSCMYSSDVIEDDISFQTFKQMNDHSINEALSQIIELKKQNNIFIIQKIIQTGRSESWYKKEFVNGDCMEFDVKLRVQPSEYNTLRTRIYKYKNHLFIRSMSFSKYY